MIRGLKMVVFESIDGHQIWEANTGTTNLLDIGSIGLEHSFYCFNYLDLDIDIGTTTVKTAPDSYNYWRITPIHALH